MHNQRGFSLFSLVFGAIVLVLALVYGQAFIVIPYTGYKVGSIMSGLIRDGNTKEYEMKKIFDERLQYEQLLDTVSSKNLTVSRGESGVRLTTEYEHCYPLWKNWTVCAQMNIVR